MVSVMCICRQNISVMEFSNGLFSNGISKTGYYWKKSTITEILVPVYDWSLQIRDLGLRCYIWLTGACCLWNGLRISAKLFYVIDVGVWIMDYILYKTWLRDRDGHEMTHTRDIRRFEELTQHRTFGLVGQNKQPLVTAAFNYDT
jgi:hypothetical protein